MAEPNAVALSHLFSELIGRKVQFAPTAPSPETPLKQIFGIYRLLPHEVAIVVKADLALLGSIAGVLVGLPDATVKDRLKTMPVDELLRDAMHEALNIASTVVTTTGRAVFEKAAFDRTYVDGAAGAVLKSPGHRSYFNVSVEGYQGGKFAIFSPFLPIMQID